MLQIAARQQLIRVTPMQRQDSLRVAIRDWLNGLMDKYGVKARQIATRAQVAPATVYRALDEDSAEGYVMSTTIIAKIAAAFGEAAPSFDGGAPVRTLPGLSEGDMAVYDAELPSLEDDLPRNRGRWRVISDVLSLEGYRPGDILEFDLSLTPRPGDIVVAQVYSLLALAAQTVLRLYQPPYLITRSLNAAADHRPLLVDGERVIVRGTMVRMVRNRPL